MLSLPNEPVVLAGPITAWLQSQVDFYNNLLPTAMLVIILAVGAWLFVSGKGGIKTVLGFGIGGVLVFMLLTNVEQFANLFKDEVTQNAPNTGGMAPPAGSIGAQVRAAVDMFPER